MSKTQQQKGGVDARTASDARQTDGADDADYHDDADSFVVQGPTDDELFELLANQRRRFVLHYLHRRPDETVSLSELSEQVAGWEHGVEPDELEYRERKSVRNSLHQFHLPKLADADIVRYDDAADEVELLNDAVVDAYHRVSTDDEPVPWSAYVIGAGAGAVGVLALVAVGVFPGAGPVAWGLAVVAAVGATLAHYALERGDDVADAPPEALGSEPDDQLE